MQSYDYPSYCSVWESEIGCAEKTESRYSLSPQGRKSSLENSQEAHGATQDRLARRELRQRYTRNGRNAMEDLQSALATRDGRPSKDYLFVAIDFEGEGGPRGVTELGISVFDTRQIFDDHAQPSLTIESRHFAVKSRDKLRFIFGDSESMSQRTLSKTLRDLFESYKGKCCGGAILVGHSLGAEVRVMDQYGVAYDTLPAISGLVDTAVSLAHWKGPKRLRDLMRMCDVPIQALHCAGNDAHFTLRVMFAFLLGKMGGLADWSPRCKALWELIQRPLATPPAELRALQ